MSEESRSIEARKDNFAFHYTGFSTYDQCYQPILQGIKSYLSSILGYVGSVGKNNLSLSDIAQNYFCSPITNSFTEADGKLEAC